MKTLGLELPVFDLVSIFCIVVGSSGCAICILLVLEFGLGMGLELDVGFYIERLGSVF